MNPLAGDGVDFWYSHGGMGLPEALREYFLAIVVNELLPLKSASVHAVISTGISTYFKNHLGEKEKVKRALVVRNFIWRPAHFERASFYRPNKHMASKYSSD